MKTLIYFSVCFKIYASLGKFGENCFGFMNRYLEKTKRIKKKRNSG